MSGRNELNTIDNVDLTNTVGSEYTLLSSAVKDNELSDIHQQLLSRWALFLDELEPALIRRLQEIYTYQELVQNDEEPFQDLLILLSADEPNNRIVALTNTRNHSMLNRIEWSAYKYAQILKLCHADVVSYQAIDNRLVISANFEGVDSYIAYTALERIIYAYGQSKVFADASDFPDQETFLHVLNTLSVEYWPHIFDLPNIDRHLEFSFEDKEDAEELLNILDEDNLREFLSMPNIMRRVLDGLEENEADKLITDNAIVKECVGGLVDEQEPRSQNSDVTDDKDLDESVDNNFEKLMNLLLFLDDRSNPRFFTYPNVVALLETFHWSAFKYASILSACAPDYGAYVKFDTTLSSLPAFDKVSQAIRQTALENILKHIQQDVSINADLVLVSASQTFSLEAESNTENIIFTHADDFPNIDALIEALNTIPQKHWPKIFALPGMEAQLHKILKFEDVSLLESNLTRFSNEDDPVAFTEQPFVLEAMLKGLLPAERVKLITTNNHVKEAYIERISQGRGDSVQPLLEDCDDVTAANVTGYEQFESNKNHMSARQIENIHILIEDEKLPLKNVPVALIQRLLPQFHYVDFIVQAKRRAFQDLLIILNADLPENRISELLDPTNTYMLRDIRWSPYKYAQILELCRSETVTYEQADEQLKNAEGFTGVTESMRSKALQDIIHSSAKQVHGLGTLELACIAFEKEVRETGSSDIFTDWADFPDQDSFLHTLNMISIDSWPTFFYLDDMDRHLDFSFDTLDDLDDILDIFDYSHRAAFLKQPDVLDAIENGLSREDFETFRSHPNVTENQSQGVIMAEYKFSSASVKNKDLPSIQAVIQSPDSGISLTDLDPELIQRLEKRYDYCQLIDSRMEPFKNLLVLLRADKLENRITALQEPANQELLKNIHWSAYKYAILLSILDKFGNLARTNAILKKLPGFQNVNPTMSQTAFLDIICSDENETPNNGLFEIACKAFWNVDDDTEEDLEQDLTHAHDITDSNLIFTHADDFDSVEQVLKALNILPRAYWSKIFSLPDMHKHFMFAFNKTDEAIKLINIFEQESDREFFLSLPNMQDAISNGLPNDELLMFVRTNNSSRKADDDVQSEESLNLSEDDDSDASYDIANLMAKLEHTDVEQWSTIPNLPQLPNLIQRDFETTFDELSELSDEKIDALLARPNVLETIFNGLSPNDRWQWIALKAPYQKAYIDCLGQGRGETILKLLGNCPFKNETEQEKAITTSVLAASKQGFEKMYEENYGTRDLLYAQCRQWHFFSPPSETTHPFIAKLEKMLAPKMSVKQQ